MQKNQTAAVDLCEVVLAKFAGDRLQHAKAFGKLYGVIQQIGFEVDIGIPFDLALKRNLERVKKEPKTS